jgi:hypothetical protein
MRRITTCIVLLLLVLAGKGWGQQGNDCYVVLGNYAGKTNLHPIILFDTVCTIMNNVNNLVAETYATKSLNSNNGFKVITRPHYLLLVEHVTDGYLQQREELYERADEISDYYLALSKEIYSDGHYHYAVKIKLPNTGAFSNINQLHLEAISREVSDVMNAFYYFYKMSWLAEVAGYAKFIELIELAQNGGYDDKIFEKNDFLYSTLSDITNLERTSESNTIQSAGNVTIVNFGNITEDGQNIADFNIPLSTLEKIQNFSVLVLYTSKKDLPNFDLAFNTFKQSNEKLKVWIHVDDELSEDAPTVRGEQSGSRNTSCKVLLDGLLGTLEGFFLIAKGTGNIIYSAFNSLYNFTKKVIENGIDFQALMDDAYNAVKSGWSKLQDFVTEASELASVLYDKIGNMQALKEMALEVKEAIMCFFIEIFDSGTIVKTLAYGGGLILFEALAAFLTGGTSTVAKGGQFAKFIGFVKNGKVGNFVSDAINNNPIKQFLCKLKILKGCFVEDTPVLMAYNPLKIADIKPLAFAAAMPLMAVPIQDVQLLDYAAAHKTVNAGYGMVAHVGDDVYTGLMDKDPYTSDQQRLRDRYELDDESWHEVVFEELNGSSKAKLALHQDWMHQQGYSVDAIVHMNLPEQGISGPFRITSIKHILPQKLPECDDIDSDYDFRPVTGLFIHQSNDVWTLRFEDGTELGVTSSHPIFSISKGGWQLAGELLVGEEVLALGGNTRLLSKERNHAIQPVYNLEVKDLHNFLVGDVGVVVHNSCANLVKGLKKLSPAQLKQHIADGWQVVIKSSDDIPAFFGVRRYFQDLMSEFRYLKEGFKSTADIADNFKALDFFKQTSVSGNTINASKVISMKTTKVADVNTWKNYSSVQANILNIKDGLIDNKGIVWNGKTIKYSNPEIHIYMPKDVFTPSLASSWKSTLEGLYPEIKFEINMLETFIK